MEVVVSPVDHAYVVPPVAVNNTESPGQKKSAPEICAKGTVLTVTETFLPELALLMPQLKNLKECCLKILAPDLILT